MYKNLRAEMAREGVKQEQVAEVTSKTVRTVYSWLNENGEISVSNAVKVQEAFFPDKEISYLFEYEQA